MYQLIRNSGLVLLLIYSFFNLGNILYFKLAVDFIGFALVVIALTYLVQRTIQVMSDGFELKINEVMVYCLIGITTCTLVLQRIFLNTYIDFDGVDTLQNIASIWMVSVLWIFIGGSVARSQFSESYVFAILIAVGVTATMGFGVDAELFKAFEVEDASEEGVRISHLTLERYIVIPMVLAYALAPKLRWIIALCAVYCLFLLGGRTPLYVFIITVVLMNITGNYARNLMILIIMGLALYFSLRFALVYEWIDPENRQVKEILFLGGVADDNSFNARVQFFRESVEDLPKQFLFGDFTVSAERYGRFGTYIHNLLSAWQFYGFFVFIAICSSLVYCLIKMFSSINRDRSPLNIFRSFLLVYVIISVVISKSVIWTMLWMVIGLWMLKPGVFRLRAQRKGARIKKRKRRKKRRSSTDWVTT